MKRYNPRTGRMEDEPGARPTGLSYLDQAPPSEVRPEDLITGGPKPGDPTSTTDLLMASRTGMMPGQRPGAPVPPSRDELDALDDLPAPPSARPPGAAASSPSRPAKPAPAQPARKAGGGGGGTTTEPAAGDRMTAGEREAKKKQDDAFQAEAGAIREEQTLNQRRAEKEAELAASEEEQLAQHQKDVDERMGAAKDYLAAKQDEAANFKVKDLFEGREAAGVAAALMVGLGQIGSAMSGTPNIAMDVLDKARASFRAKQMTELDQKYRAVDDAKERIELTRMEAAAAESGLMKRMAAERAKNMATFGADQARIEGDKVYQGLLQRQAAAEQQWQTNLYERGRRELMQDWQIKDIKSQIGLRGAQAQALRDKPAPGAPDEELLVVTGPGGKPLFRARSPKEAEEAKEQQSVVGDILAKAGELKGLLEKGWTFFGTGERAAKMESLQAQLMSKVRLAEKMGALDKGSVEIAEKMIPARAGATGGGAARLEQFIKGTRESAARSFDRYGVPGAKVVAQIERGAGEASGEPAPSREEFAQVMQALRAAKPGSPQYQRLFEAARGMRAAMGR